MMNLEVRIESSNMTVEWRCWVCRRPFDLDHITAILYADGVKLGDICPDCFKGGPDGIRKTLLAVGAELRDTSETIAEDMREEAAELEGMAAGDISCPTQEEWRGLQQEAIKAYQDQQESMEE